MYNIELRLALFPKYLEYFIDTKLEMPIYRLRKKCRETRLVPGILTVRTFDGWLEWYGFKELVIGGSEKVHEVIDCPWTYENGRLVF